MVYNDAEFDKLLTTALFRAAELDYVDSLSDEELEQKVQPSSRFKRRMDALLRNPNRYVRNQRRPLYLKVLRSAAAVFIAITVVFSGAMAVSPTVRAAVVNFVRTWFEDRTVYEIPSHELDNGWTVGYIPDGFELIEELDLGLQLILFFEDNDSATIFIQFSTGKQIVDNEHSVFYEITVNGNPTDIYESNDVEHPSIIVMHEEKAGVFVTIISKIDVRELIRIAENIR